jgi:hypothetical protein
MNRETKGALNENGTQITKGRRIEWAADACRKIVRKTE